MKFVYSHTAERQYDELPSAVRTRFSAKMRFFEQQGNVLQFAKKLTGYEAYRLRVGNYRVVFKVCPNVFLVVLIEKRDKAYRDL